MSLKKYDFKKIALLADIVIFLILIIGVLISPNVNEKNTIFVNGHYDGIEKVVAGGRGGGDISYNLYIKERRDYYKISADYSDCVVFDGLRSRVKEGEPIRIYLNNPVPFFSIGDPVVVAVRTQGGDYLSFDCVNKEIKDDKVKLPLLMFAVGALIAGLIYKKEVILLFKSY